jgi:hypothetical protein
MNTYMDARIAADRRKEAMAFAKQERQLAQISRQDTRLVGRYQRWLARLGTQLVVWGSRLETRYAEPLYLSTTTPREH